MPTIRFKADTAVDLTTVGRKHIGKVQMRPRTQRLEDKDAAMEPFFPAGTVLDLPDYVADGSAEIVTE